MSNCLAWRLLSAADIAALATADISTSARIILDADAAIAAKAPVKSNKTDAAPSTAVATGPKSGVPALAGPSPAAADAASSPAAAYFTAPLVTNDTQKFILLDAVFHLLRFARGAYFSDMKQSTLVSLFLSLHRTCMEEGLLLEGAFGRLSELLTEHSVHRPPYCTAIFDITDVRVITDYIVGSYLRFYSLYTHAFTRRRELTVAARLLGDLNEVPPALPPLCGATPLDVWQHQAAEQQRQAAEEEGRRIAAIEEQQRRREAEERARAEAEAAADREIPQGLRAQLTGIRSQISRASLENIAALEAKVAAIEARVLAEGGVFGADGLTTVASSGGSGKPSSGGGAKRPAQKR
jgi:hypothetical protein